MTPDGLDGHPPVDDKVEVRRHDYQVTVLTGVGGWPIHRLAALR
jgi:hypothetical protein